MPGYPELDLVWPNRSSLWAAADRARPDVVHVSTPGPVGSCGRVWALRRGVPLVGTYHTDFPAYVDHLFDDRLLTWVCTLAMRGFYQPFARVFTRSREYVPALERLGVESGRIERLAPGIDVGAFGRRNRDAAGSIWGRVPGVRCESVKAIYVGRVSVEKNLKWLSGVWPAVWRSCAARGFNAQLVVVGDGPHRPDMERQLRGRGAAFAGVRHGAELAAMYASSDVFVFPSTTDTLGQVVMEAQASGLPAVVSDRGGPAEMVEDGVTGLVLPVEPAGVAHARWVEALTGLLTDPARSRRMGEAASAKIAPMSIERSFEHFWDVHERVHREYRGAKATTPACIRAGGR